MTGNLTSARSARRAAGFIGTTMIGKFLRKTYGISPNGCRIFLIDSLYVSSYGT
jgi:hypothetical protein